MPTEATSDPLTLLIQRPSAVNVVATTQQRFDATVGSRAGGFTATYPEPMARAEVVLAVGDGRSIDDSTIDALSGALLADGWDAADGAPTALPSAATLVRIAELWEENR